MTNKKLFSRKELIEKGYPFGKAFEGIPMGDADVEWKRTNPDIVVYRPKGSGIYDGDNEHFLVFEAPKSDELMAVWNQSSCEGRGDNHLVISRSKDGEKWSQPEYMVGSEYGEFGNQASWGFPIVTEKGRIYVIYSRQAEQYDNAASMSGTMGCIYSDDNGISWSEPDNIRMPVSRYDNPKNWIVFQKPIKDKDGYWFTGYTLWTSYAVYPEKKERSWINKDSRCMFMRFVNIEENPEPKDVKIEWLPDGDTGLQVPNSNYEDMSTAQEPSVVLLADGRLFTVMRTTTGYMYYSVSSDNGHRWTKPEALRYEDGGGKIPHPMSPGPIYRLHDGRYILIYHNNKGKRLGFYQNDPDWQFNYANFLRNPTYISYGEYVKDAKQPIHFDEPIKMFDTDDIAIGPKKTAEVCTYSSVTHWKGKTVLWYPDRKHFLLGRYI